MTVRSGTSSPLGKTWDNFKTHFLQAQTQLCQQQTTTQQMGYMPPFLIPTALNWMMPRNNFAATLRR